MPDLKVIAVQAWVKRGELGEGYAGFGGDTPTDVAGNHWVIFSAGDGGTTTWEADLLTDLKVCTDEAGVQWEQGIEV